MFDFKKLVVKYLRDAADRINSGECEISENEAMDIMRVIAHEPLSKEKACSYMNMSRSKFDDLVRENKILKGQKRAGFKELVFYRDELDLAVKKMEYGKKK